MGAQARWDGPRPLMTTHGCFVADSQRLGRSSSYWVVAVLFVIGLFVVAAFILYKFKRQGSLVSLSRRGCVCACSGLWGEACVHTRPHF